MHLLNNFNKKVVLNKLRDFNILSILVEESVLDDESYHFFVDIKGLVVPIRVNPPSNYDNIKLEFVDGPGDINEFYIKVENEILHKIKNFRSLVDFDKSVDNEHKREVANFIVSLINDQLAVYELFNIISDEDYDEDYYYIIQEECVAMLDCGLSLLQTYHKVIDNLGLDNKEIISVIENCSRELFILEA